MDLLTSRQISEWEVYDRLDPIGTGRDDYRMSYMASLLVNLFIKTYGKKGATLTAVKDFLLDWSGDIKEFEENKMQSLEEMKEMLSQIAGYTKKVGLQPDKTKPPIRRVR